MHSNKCYLCNQKSTFNVLIEKKDNPLETETRTLCGNCLHANMDKISGYWNLISELEKK